MEKTVEIMEKNRIADLFAGWEETLIWSCLQDCMGRAFADSVENPRSAQILVGDFCFFAGRPSESLVRNKPDDRESNFVIMVPSSEEWAHVIEEVYQGCSKKIKRYAIKKEPDVFDKDKLENIVKNCPKGFSLRRIDEEVYRQAMENPWSADLCSQFKDYEDYRERGLGTAAFDGHILAAGASSYTVYRGGIEIEVDTRRDYRRKGLALCCAAQLILDCLEWGLYPSWDAHNPASVALSEKLGYHFEKEYTAYEVYRFTGKEEGQL